MARDRDPARLQRHGRAVRSAYHAARLTPSQHDRHRARLAERYDHPFGVEGRWTRLAGGAVAVSIVVLLVALSVVVWGDLTAEHEGDDDDAAAFTPLPTTTIVPRETALPSATATAPDPTATRISRETLFGYYESTETCRTTPVSTGRPRDESQAAFTDTWYGYAPDALWAGLGPENEGIWTTSNRVLWWRGNPIPVEVSGRRLDGDAPPMQTNLFDGYDGFSHHASILTFPMPGCWEIEASAGNDVSLRIVVEVSPYEESPAGLQVHQQKVAVTAERETLTPYPVPVTCPSSVWAGPESRIYNQYPATLIGEEDWQYSYFLHGESLSLNTRIGLLLEGDNSLVWLSATGNLSENILLTVSKLEDDGSTTSFELELPDYDSVVSDGSGGYITVYGMALNFPSSGCWTLTVEGEDVGFSHMVYVYPRDAIEAINVAIAERDAMTPYPPPGVCHNSESVGPAEWAGPENRTGGWYPASIASDEDWGYAYYMEGENVTLISRRGVLYEGPNTLVWITGSDHSPADWTFNATLLESPDQFGIGGMEGLGFESTTIEDPRNPGSTLAAHGQSLRFDVPGCWVLIVQSDEVAFNHYLYVYPRVDREAALDHERLYVVENDGRVWGWSLDEDENRNLFQISIGSGVDAALSLDGTRLYLAGGGSLSAHDALTGAELWRTPIEHKRNWQQPEKGPSNIAISADGRRIFVASIERQDLPWIQIFDAGDGAKLGDTEIVHGNCPANMHVSPDGGTLYLVCITNDEGLKIFDLDTGAPGDLIEGQFASSAVSPDGRLLYAVTTAQRLFTIDMDSREVISEIELDVLAPPERFLQLAAVAPDGSRLYIGLGRESSERGAAWEDVREIATIDLTDGSTLDVFEADFIIDRGGLEIDGAGNLHVNSAGRIMRIAGDEAEALRIFVEVDASQFLIARPDK